MSKQTLQWDQTTDLHLNMVFQAVCTCNLAEPLLDAGGLGLHSEYGSEEEHHTATVSEGKPATSAAKFVPVPPCSLPVCETSSVILWNMYLLALDRCRVNHWSCKIVVKLWQNWHVCQNRAGLDKNM